MNFLNKFIDAMIAAGYGPENTSDIVDTGGESRLIRAAGDKTGAKTLYYSYREDGNFAAGHWYSCKTSEGDSWYSRIGTKLTAEEKAAIKARQEQDRADREARLLEQHNRVAADTVKYLRGLSKATEHPYLTRKGIGAVGKIDGDKLVFGAVDIDWKIWTAQTIDADGFKLFVTDGRKKGTFYPIGLKPSDNLETLVICEGVATGASIYEATGYPVMVAWDKGNLMSVAMAARGKWPDARIIVAGDNDQWSEGNPGKDAASKAAGKIKGFVLIPDFDADNPDKPKDWNDASKIYGLEYIKDTFCSLKAPPAIQEVEQIAPGGDEGPHLPDVTQPTGGDFYIPDDPPVMAQEDGRNKMGLPFRVLGYNDGDYYYYSYMEKQIIKLAASAHTLPNLLRLADLTSWKRWVLGGGKGEVSQTQLVSQAMDGLLALSREEGLFHEAANVRGCGAWLDAKRAVLHCGDVLYVDGVRTELEQIKSKYVYISAPRLLVPAMEPLGASAARELREVCELPTWENPLSGTLLAGWLVIAPICSILGWRPHIWVTGESGSGKSTILNRIIKPVLGDMALCVDGGTSEPAIRQIMGYDARPLVYDEAEADRSGTLMDGVLMLARKASSGSIITKYGQRPFNARFCACFSAINPPVKDFADETRISMMVLRKNRKLTAREEYTELCRRIDNLLTEDYSKRLLARTIANMPNLLENIITFKNAAAKVLNDSRSADQIAPMLAGCYLLSSSGLITEQAAYDWVVGKDWTTHTAIAADSDPVRLVAHIVSSLIRVQNTDTTISEMIMDCIYKKEDAQSKMYEKILRQYGIVVEKDGIVLANRNQNLARLLKGTDWSSNWSRTLSDYPDAKPHKGIKFIPGEPVSRSVKIPLTEFLND